MHPSALLVDGISGNKQQKKLTRYLTLLIQNLVGSDRCQLLHSGTLSCLPSNLFRDRIREAASKLAS